MPNTTIDIDSLKLKELQVLYHDTFGKTTASRNRSWLVKKLRAAMAEDASSAKPAPKKERKTPTPTAKPKPKPAPAAAAKQDKTEAPAGVSKAVAALGLEVGTVIEKNYKGQIISVVVREHGFEVGGKLYKSLSAAAKDIAGCNWNGHVFFGLKKRGGATA